MIVLRVFILVVVAELQIADTGTSIVVDVVACGIYLLLKI
jgi:hypothetical protein